MEKKQRKALEEIKGHLDGQHVGKTSDLLSFLGRLGYRVVGNGKPHGEVYFGNDFAREKDGRRITFPNTTEVGIGTYRRFLESLVADFERRERNYK